MAVTVATSLDDTSLLDTPPAPAPLLVVVLLLLGPNSRNTLQ